MDAPEPRIIGMTSMKVKSYYTKIAWLKILSTVNEFMYVTVCIY